LLGRDRLRLLLDEDSFFLEIGSLSGWNQDEKLEGNPLVGGIGLVSGVECVILCNIPTIGGGAMNSVTGRTWKRCSDISIENHLPFIQLLESSGADLSQVTIYLNQVYCRNKQL
jgi:acyl-CoA carboxylase subunit beta